MAEPEDLGADQGDLLADPEEETEAGAEEMTEDSTAGEADTTDRFTDEPPPDDAEAQKWFKHWQSSYTKTRQKDRERTGKLVEEHSSFKNLLQNFYQSDEYALQILRQRFPQLAGKLSLDGTPAAGTQTGANGKLVQMLQQKLGTDLAFLAQPLAEAMQAAVGDAIAPEREHLQRERQQEQAQARQQQEQTLFADMDTKYPGWEDRYGTDMQALDQFLAGDTLEHPKFGNKYELLYKLLNRDQGRIDAARGMQQAARTRIGTGRTGRPAEANITDRVAKAASNSEAFRLAAQAALEELGR